MPVGYGLPILVRIDDLRLLVNRLRKFRLRHAFRRSRLLDGLPEAQADLPICGAGTLEKHNTVCQTKCRPKQHAETDHALHLRESSSVSRSNLARFCPSTPFPELLPAVTNLKEWRSTSEEYVGRRRQWSDSLLRNTVHQWPAYAQANF